MDPVLVIGIGFILNLSFFVWMVDSLTKKFTENNHIQMKLVDKFFVEMRWAEDQHQIRRQALEDKLLVLTDPEKYMVLKSSDSEAIVPINTNTEPIPVYFDTDTNGGSYNGQE